MAAKIRGVALVGDTVSANRRLYRAPVVKHAVAAAQERIRQGRMLVHVDHDTGAGGIAGRVTALTYDGATKEARFEAELLPTGPGAHASAITNGTPHAAVSIAGQWVGPITSTKHTDGQLVEHAPALELHSIDLVSEPGVAAARVLPREQQQLVGAIHESAPGAFVVDQATTDLTALSGSQLRTYLAAAYRAADDAVAQTAVNVPEGATAGERMAAELRADHAIRVARQRRARAT